VLYTHDDYSRPLSEDGVKSVPKVTRAFENIHLDAIVSSPYIRVLDTIGGVSKLKDMEIQCFDDLRERKVAHTFIDDFQTFTDNQWKDFDFHLEGGESLREVQHRGTAVIESLIDNYEGKNVLVGTHGTFLAVQLNHFNPEIDFNFWRRIQMPDIFKATFDGYKMVNLENIKI